MISSLFIQDEIGRKMFKKSWPSLHLDAVENYSVFAKILQVV